MEIKERRYDKMILLILFIFIVVALIYIIKNKIVIRIDTFFRKGFSKHDDNYGIYCFAGKQGDRQNIFRY